MPCSLTMPMSMCTSVVLRRHLRTTWLRFSWSFGGAVRSLELAIACAGGGEGGGSGGGGGGFVVVLKAGSRC